VTKRMESSLASRGMGRGGTYGSGLRSVELSRAGELGSLEAKLAAMEQEHQDRLIEEATRFAFGSPSGSTTTTTGSTDALGSAAGGATETATLLYMLQRLMAK